MFFLIGASATKSFARLRMFRYGLLKDILSKGQNTKGGGGRTAPPPSWIKRLSRVSDPDQGILVRCGSKFAMIIAINFLLMCFLSKEGVTLRRPE